MKARLMLHCHRFSSVSGPLEAHQLAGLSQLFADSAHSQHPWRASLGEGVPHSKPNETSAPSEFQTCEAMLLKDNGTSFARFPSRRN